LNSHDKKARTQDFDFCNFQSYDINFTNYIIAIGEIELEFEESGAVASKIHRVLDNHRVIIFL